MKEIRLLVVEDDAELLSWLKKQYREVFSDLGYHAITIEEARNPEEARTLAKGAEKKPYDLVSLDVELGGKPREGIPPESGVDVLLAFKRYKSAWMVAVLTGVETSRTADQTFGLEEADALRKQLRREAYSNFWPERLFVVEKPAAGMFEENKATAEELLRTRLEQIALVYGEVNRQRYIFRPIEVKGTQRIPKKKGSKGPRKTVPTLSTHWQIRFNVGDIRTLPNTTGFKTLHKLLSLDPTKAESLTPEAALVLEPRQNEGKVDAGTTPENESDEDPFAAYFIGFGITNWRELTIEEKERLVRVHLEPLFKRYSELRQFQDDDDLSADEADELDRLKPQLGNLAAQAEERYRREAYGEAEAQGPQHEQIVQHAAAAQQGLGAPRANYDQRQGGWGYDSPEAELFRQRMVRVKKSLRENGFENFADHLDDYLSSTGANWSYHPPEAMQWTLS